MNDDLSLSLRRLVSRALSTTLL